MRSQGWLARTPRWRWRAAVDQRLLAADRLVDGHRRVDGPRDQGELGDGLTAEGQPLGGIVVPAAVGEPLVGGGGLEDLHLLLEHLAVVKVVGVVAVAHVDPEHVRLALLGAAAEATEEPPAGKHVGQGVVLGEVDGVPGGQHVDQRAQADAPGVLGQHRVQENDVGDDLESVVMEVMLRRPQGIVAEGVAGFRVRDEVRVGAAVVRLAVVPRVRRRPVHSRVGHVDRPVEERPEVHPDLPSPRAG